MKMHGKGLRSSTVHAAGGSAYPGKIVTLCNGRTMEGTPTSEPITCKACLKYVWATPEEPPRKCECSCRSIPEESAEPGKHHSELCSMFE